MLSIGLETISLIHLKKLLVTQKKFKMEPQRRSRTPAVLYVLEVQEILMYQATSPSSLTMPLKLRRTSIVFWFLCTVNLSYCSSLTAPYYKYDHRVSQRGSIEEKPKDATRRASFATLGTLSTGIFASNNAHAVQPRNEVLCSTGFFENIWQYKCTELGDIEQDGKAADLNAQESQQADSLLGKLMLETETKEPKPKEPEKCAE